MTRRSGVDDVLLPWQFEALFRRAARIEEFKHAVEFAGLLWIAGRIGARNGETLHTCEDYLVRLENGQIVAYQIPMGMSCVESCPVCKDLAKRTANRVDKDVDWRDLLGDYTPKSHAGGRKIPVLKERGREILDLYQEIHGRGTPISKQTFRNRMIRLQEVCDEVDAHVYPQSLRATAANYWVIMGMIPSDLQIMFGWKYPSTALFYVRKSDRRLRVQMQRLMGREVDQPYDIDYEPKTFSEIRRSSDLEPVGKLTPQKDRSVPGTDPDPDTDPLEEYAQKRLEHRTFDEFQFAS